MNKTVDRNVLSGVSFASGAPVEGYFLVRFRGLLREFTRMGAYPLATWFSEVPSLTASRCVDEGYFANHFLRHSHAGESSFVD